MKKFKARFGTVREYEVVSETPKRIIYNDGSYLGLAEHKETESHFWADTKQECVDWLLRREQGKILIHESQIKYIEQNIEKLKQL